MHYEHLRRAERKVARIEQIADQIVRELKLEHDDTPALAEVRDLIRAGDKLEAIKRYRAHMGITLREARQTVDAVAREMHT
jgi:ribosomal protein L7/L12